MLSIPRSSAAIVNCTRLSFTDVRGMGVMAGAVVGVSFGVLIIILIIWLVFRKKEKKKYEEEETPNEIRSVPQECVFLWIMWHGCIECVCVCLCVCVGLCAGVSTRLYRMCVCYKVKCNIDCLLRVFFSHWFGAQGLTGKTVVSRLGVAHSCVWVSKHKLL